MDRAKHSLWLRTIKLLNIIMITIPFAVCWESYYNCRIASHYGYKGTLVIILLYALMYINMVRVYEGLQVSLKRISEMVYSQVLSFLFADGFIYLVIWLLAKRFLNILPGIACIAVQVIASVVWSFAAHKIYFKVCSAQKTAIVFETREGLESIISEYEMEKKFDVQLTLQAKECLCDLSVLDDYKTVFLSGVHSHDRNIILKYCVERDIRLYIIPRVGDVIMSGAKQMHMFHLPMLRVGRYNPNPEYVIIKRIFDIIASSAAIIILSPIMAVTAIAIKAYDGGPALYKQVRLTKDGKEFEILKFRSMRVDAEANGIARLSTGDNDDRITPVGHIIRKIRFDELPQLFNILKGELSIVGPRPERPEIAAQYCEEMPEFNLRLQAKAGLTGYAQVYGKYNTTPYDKLQMDLMYIAKPSIWEDLNICFATIKILFMPESTEGVAEGQITAMAGETEVKEEVGVS